MYNAVFFRKLGRKILKLENLETVRVHFLIRYYKCSCGIIHVHPSNLVTEALGAEDILVEICWATL